MRGMFGGKGMPSEAEMQAAQAQMGAKGGAALPPGFNPGGGFPGMGGGGLPPGLSGFGKKK